MKKSSNEFENWSNITFLREKRLSICLSYVFSGINLILAGICANAFQGKTELVSVLIFLGGVFFFMTLIQIIDPCRVMSGLFVAITSGLMHFVSSVVVAYVYSYWWIMFIYGMEVVILIIAVLCSLKIRRHPVASRSKE